MSKQNGVESKVREIRRKTRKRYSAEEKIRIVLEGLRGEESIAALCRKENGQLKELVADLSLKNVVLKKSLAGTGGDLDA